jgi:hypothetical protein
MENTRLLIVAMAEQCRAVARESTRFERELPHALHPRHLLWMCDCITAHAEEWPITKLHRWIGFVQSGMLANRMLDLAGVKAMFDEAKRSYGGGNEDQDLLDHLDPGSSFTLDIGGQG